MYPDARKTGDATYGDASVAALRLSDQPDGGLFAVWLWAIRERQREPQAALAAHFATIEAACVAVLEYEGDKPSREETPAAPIIIELVGGIVDAVRAIPKGTLLEVRDYDPDESGHADPRRLTDEKGCSYLPTVWERIAEDSSIGVIRE